MDGLLWMRPGDLFARKPLIVARELRVYATFYRITPDLCPTQSCQNFTKNRLATLSPPCPTRMQADRRSGGHVQRLFTAGLGDTDTLGGAGLQRG